MKAWKVDDRNAEYGTAIVFAPTRGKAKAIALHNDDTFDDCEWTDLRAYRFPEYDKYYDGSEIVDFWYSDEHRVRLVRDFGWSCVEQIESQCEECPAKQWCLT